MVQVVGMTNKHDDITTSLKKAGSLIDTIIRMEEDGKYCVDIMQQNLAAIGLLKSVQQKLMKHHLETCFVEGVRTGSRAKQNQLISEIEQVMKMGN